MGKLMDNNRLKLREVIYDFSIDGGAVGTINLQGYFPPKTLFVGAYMRALTDFNSGGAATVALGLNGVATNSLMAATAFGSLPTAGNAGRGVDLDAAPVYAAAESWITMTIAAAALTAGRAVIYVKYLEADV